MPTSLPAPPQFRTECPPGACICERARLFDNPEADRRVLLLTREQEKRLIERIDAISTYAELQRIGQRLYEQLGLRLQIGPRSNEVRTARGFAIELSPVPGLCRKTRQAVPAAIRRCLERHPEIAYAVLDAHDLLGPR